MNLNQFFANTSRSSVASSTEARPAETSQPVEISTVSIAKGLVLYKRAGSPAWQCRFKLPSGEWHRVSTGIHTEEEARVKAIELQQRWLARVSFGFPAKRLTFERLAQQVINELDSTTAAKRGKAIYRDYKIVLVRYLIPFFGRHCVEDITPEVTADFDSWRTSQMGRVPTASTMRTHACAFNRVMDAAKARGLLPSNRPIPQLEVTGKPSEPRPAFTQQEIEHLLSAAATNADSGKGGTDREIRQLLRDYVEFLLATGARPGKESLNLRWRHLQWHYDQDQRYLRVWVTGKTGPRYLIAKHSALPALERCARRVGGETATLDSWMGSSNALVFTLSSKYQPVSLNGCFKHLLQAAGLLKDISGKNRTLYSLRHTYATFALRDGISIHTLARQMGTSVLMLEKHYSKLTPMMNAAELSK